MQIITSRTTGGRLQEDFSHKLVVIAAKQEKQKEVFHEELRLLLERLPEAVRSALEEKTGEAARDDGDLEQAIVTTYRRSTSEVAACLKRSSPMPEARS